MTEKRGRNQRMAFNAMCEEAKKLNRSNKNNLFSVSQITEFQLAKTKLEN